MKLSPEFVKSVPAELEDGVIYISMEYRTAIHNCCCGCGEQVVTPFSPKGWRLIFDGKTISIQPSIGNWGFDCRSHYWITSNEVKWVLERNDDEVKRGRFKDEADRSKQRNGNQRLSKLWGFFWKRK